jgi:hypothetical protein
MSALEPMPTPRITFSAVQMTQLFGTLPPLTPELADYLAAELGIALGRYMRSKAQDDACQTKGQVRKTLQLLANERDHKHASGMARVNECYDSAFLIRLAAKSKGQDVDDHGRPIVNLKELAAVAMELLPDKRGPAADPSLWQFIWTLLYLYEAITGEKPTHNPYQKTDYKGGNDVFHSACDRFVSATIRIISRDFLGDDPISLPLTATYMQQIIRQGVSRRRRRRPEPPIETI